MARRLLALCALVLVLAAIVALNPHDVVSLGGKPHPDNLDMSPMGRIAAGLDPRPEVSLAPPVPNQTIGRILSAGTSDVLTHSPIATDYQSETTIARFGNAIVVGYNDTRGFAFPSPRVSGFAYSSDGGVSFTDGGDLPNTLTDQVFGDPDVKVWKNPNTGVVTFVYSSIYVTTGGLQTMCVHVSTNGGATWVGPREVTPATLAGSSADKSFIDIDPETGRLFISWTNFPTSGTVTIRTAYSDDFGLNWSAASIFTSGQGSVPRAAGNGSPNAYVAWNDLGGGLAFVRSIDNGVTWSAPVIIVSGLVTPMNPYGSDRIHGFPSMAVDQNNGNIYIVYASRNLPPDFSDVYFMRSTNGGASFTSPVAINSNPGSDRAQFFPWVAADETDGTVSAIWYDQRGGIGTSDLTELVHTHSVNGGLNWSCPAALSDRAFHAEAGNRTSQPNLGDYIQCVSQGGTLYTAFAKTDFQSWTTYAPDTYLDASAGNGPGPAPLGFVSYTFTDSGCRSGNGFMEPGETISLTATIKNIGGCGGLSNAFATLTTTTPGINITTAAATFPGMASFGSTSSNSTPFVFTIGAGVPCGTKIDFKIDYVMDLFGPGSLPFEGTVFVGHPVSTLLLLQNFDSVVAPALPAGWTSSLLVGTSNPWRTSTAYGPSAPNSVFCADIATTSHNELQSPTMFIPGGTDIVHVELDEAHNSELDSERRAWDGAAMRLLLGGVRYFNGGAGNMKPFYGQQMNRAASSQQPLQDLACWSGNQFPLTAHVTTDFPDLDGQFINLVFGMSCDPSVGTVSGQFIDNIVVTAIDYQCDCTDPPVLAVGPSSVNFGNVPVNTTVCDTLTITNNGPTNLSISSITGCGSAPFSINTSGTIFLLAPGQSTTMIVCANPTTSGSPSCNITIASNDPNGPAIIPVSIGQVTAAGPLPLAFDRVTIVPNPFNPETSIRFNLPSRTTVTAQVWSVSGALVRTLAQDRVFAAGAVELRWNGMNDTGSPVASGIYFVRVKSPLGEHIARAVMLK
jgi:hypothetical protein